MMEKMAEAEVQAELKGHPEWSETGGAIQRTCQFTDFVQAMAFVNKVAAAAEAAQHHPDILVRWNKVTLTLSTHDAGGITDKDFELASTVDTLCPAPAAAGAVPAAPAAVSKPAPAKKPKKA